MSTICFKVENRKLYSHYNDVAIVENILGTFLGSSWHPDSVSLFHIPFVLTENIITPIEHQYYSLNVAQNKLYFPKSNFTSNNGDVSPMKVFLKISQGAPRWLSQLSVDFGSGHDLSVSGFECRIWLCADSSEPGACMGFCVSLSLPFPARAISLSFSQK